MKKSFIKEVRNLADVGFDIPTIANKLGKPVLEICEAIMLLDTLPAPKVKQPKQPKQKSVPVNKEPKPKKERFKPNPFPADIGAQQKATKFIAKPYNENFLDAVTFPSIKDAVSYLNEFTETKMPAKDWSLINKLLFVKPNGTIGTVVL
jgi:hypothetical protein